MPIYEFQWRDVSQARLEIQCPVAELDEVTTALAAIGYQRVYSRPNIIVVPTFSEAMEESTKLKEQLEREGTDATL